MTFLSQIVRDFFTIFHRIYRRIHLGTETTVFEQTLSVIERVVFGIIFQTQWFIAVFKSNTSIATVFGRKITRENTHHLSPTGRLFLFENAEHWQRVYSSCNNTSCCLILIQKTAQSLVFQKKNIFKYSSNNNLKLVLIVTYAKERFFYISFCRLEKRFSAELLSFK